LNFPISETLTQKTEFLNAIFRHFDSTVMTFTAKKVAVIGAGVSGITSAKHLKAAGVDVVVYERSSTCGGNW
jgi:NADPH-dependent glutamate synthase beta subunit-like oxidoreductase